MSTLKTLHDEFDLLAGTIQLWLQKYWEHPLVIDWAAEFDWTLCDRIWVSAKVINDRAYIEDSPNEESEMMWVRHPQPIFHYSAYGCQSLKEFAQQMLKDKTSPLHAQIRELCRLVSDHHTEYLAD